MRNFLILLFLLLIIFLTRYCQSCCSVWGNCATEKAPICADPKVSKDSFYCQQVITLGNNPLIVDELGKKNFKKIDSCNCSSNLALWESKTDNAVDLIGVIDDKTSGGAITDSIGLNYLVDFKPDKSERRQTDTPFVRPPVAPTNNIKIAIVDSGVDTTYSDIVSFLFRQPYGTICTNLVLVSQFGINAAQLTAKPSDNNGHGTQVNGVVIGMSGAEAGSDGKIKIDVLNAKFTADSSSRGTLFHALCAGFYAIEQGAKVINFSWGFESDTVPSLILPFLEEAQNKDVLIVAGVGNGSMDIDQKKTFWPAAFARDTFSYLSNPATKISNVISVGSVSATNIISSFSNKGDTTVNIYALGENVQTASIERISGQLSLTHAQGTSMATPFVTRTAAIIRGLNPAMNVREVKKRILDRAKEMNKGTPNYFKRLDHNNAIL